MSTIEQAYAEVERVTRRRAKNFAYGIMVLPRAKRRALAAVYAFAREVDDIADGELPHDEKRARLLALDELRELLRFEAVRAASLLAAGETLRAHIGGRLGLAVGMFARGGLAALGALEDAAWDVFTQRPRPSRARLAREAVVTLVR